MVSTSASDSENEESDSAMRGTVRQAFALFRFPRHMFCFLCTCYLADLWFLISNIGSGLERRRCNQYEALSCVRYAILIRGRAFTDVCSRVHFTYIPCERYVMIFF